MVRSGTIRPWPRLPLVLRRAVAPAANRGGASRRAGLPVRRPAGLHRAAHRPAVRRRAGLHRAAHHRVARHRGARAPVGARRTPIPREPARAGVPPAAVRRRAGRLRAVRRPAGRRAPAPAVGRLGGVVRARHAARARPRSPAERPMAGDPKWGGLARRGAGRLEEGGSGASSTWRDVMAAAREEAERHGPPDRHVDEWVRVDEVPRGGVRGRLPWPSPTAGGGAGRPRGRGAVGAEPIGGCSPGTSSRAAPGRRLPRLHRGAVRRRNPHPAEAGRGGPQGRRARELYGLTLYRQAKWRPAIKELEAFRMLTGSTEQNPVLADCYRAFGDYGMVDDLWEELRQASPSTRSWWWRVASWWPGAWPTAMTSVAPSASWSRAGACPDDRRSTTSAGPTHWPTSTSAPATWPGPASCSAACAATDPDFADVRVRLRSLA